MGTVFDVIKKRRSIRIFTEQIIQKEAIIKLLEAASWAPSGKNGQPWKFAVITENNKLKRNLSELTVYRNLVKKAPCIILVFLDKSISYDYVKDIQAIGASIQNMLLTAHEMGLGTCWIGEILKSKSKINEILTIDSIMELMAAIIVGYTNSQEVLSSRRNVEESIIMWE